MTSRNMHKSQVNIYNIMDGHALHPENDQRQRQNKNGKQNAKRLSTQAMLGRR